MPQRLRRCVQVLVLAGWPIHGRGGSAMTLIDSDAPVRSASYRSADDVGDYVGALRKMADQAGDFCSG